MNLKEFYESTLYMTSKIFTKIVIEMANFKKMVKIIIEFGKIRKFILVIIFVIFSQNWQFKNKYFQA